jgi:glycosyltransferase involved in cell wall biosynthesis
MPQRILQIGNYPPPFCGWSVQTKLLVEEIRNRGHVCDVLNLSENRAKKSHEYTDVQNGFDYLYKLIHFAFRRYRFQVHVNGQSKTGYILALMAALIGRLSGSSVALSWRGGLHQKYFPCSKTFAKWAYRLLFQLSGKISCNNQQVKEAIEQYRIRPDRVVAIPAFSMHHVAFRQVLMARETEIFLASHHPVFFCYVSFRPEYDLLMLREAMRQFRQKHKRAGFIWVGFPLKEMPAVNEFAGHWQAEERESLLLLGNLSHDEFLTLLNRSFAYIRTPACDGVSSSILEALAFGVPVVASENGSRPHGVITYRAGHATDLCAKLVDMAEQGRQRHRTQMQSDENNIAKTVDWLLGHPGAVEERREESVVHVAQ